MNIKKKYLYILITLLIIIFIIFFKSISIFLFGGQKEINPNGELIKLIIQVIGGLILLFGAYYSLKIAEASKENNKLIEKGNIAERFKNAIEMLNNDNQSICLSGIYALNEIAKDNLEYREQVFNILVEYINYNTRNLPSWLEIQKPARFSVQPSIQIMTILTLLFSREKTIFKKFKATFENTKLYGAKLDKFNFSRCIFRNVQLQNSSFQDTWFIDSKIYNSDFTFSDFTGAYFTDAKIWDNTNFSCCFLCGVRFTGTWIQLTDFSCSNIQESYFYGVKMNLCIFNGVQFMTYHNFNFNAASMFFKNIKGLEHVGHEIIARGANRANSISNFEKRINSIIGQKAKIEYEEQIEIFPIIDIEKFENILDLDNTDKFYYHTVRAIKNGNHKPNGLNFSDIGELTEKDAKEIILHYKKTLKMLDDFENFK